MTTTCCSGLMVGRASGDHIPGPACRSSRDRLGVSFVLRTDNINRYHGVVQIRFCERPVSNWMDEDKMTTELFSDEKIVESWGRNARPWTTAVRKKQIESRQQVTDRAVIDAILSCSPGSVLDIGCGEGWLVREMSARNINAVGVDVVPALIEEAQRAGGGDFITLSYEDIAAGRLSVSVDVMVCNFSLIGKESVEGLLSVAPSLLNEGGYLVVQTLHPVTACGDAPYREGWREGSWDGFNSDFSDPPPWYFRTLGNWTEMFVESGFNLHEVCEPLHPETRKPASIVFIAGTD